MNSVLLTLHTYWATIFLIPKKVLEEISAIYKNFLWSGKAVHFATNLVAWDLVCRPKTQGGLGIKDCCNWNLALMTTYTWHIASKWDSLWIKWVDHLYLKGTE